MAAVFQLSHFLGNNGFYDEDLWDAYVRTCSREEKLAVRKMLASDASEAILKFRNAWLNDECPAKYTTKDASEDIDEESVKEDINAAIKSRLPKLYLPIPNPRLERPEHKALGIPTPEWHTAVFDTYLQKLQQSLANIAQETEMGVQIGGGNGLPTPATYRSEDYGRISEVRKMLVAVNDDDQPSESIVYRMMRSISVPLTMILDITTSLEESPRLPHSTRIPKSSGPLR